MPEATLPAEEAAAPPTRGRTVSRRAIAWLLAAAAYWLVLFLGTHTPGRDLPVTIWDYDKLMHAGAYFVLTTILLIAWRRTGARPGLGGRLVIAAIAMAYGAIDELTQPYFERSCDLFDWFADVMGIAAAVAIDTWRHRKG